MTPEVIPESMRFYNLIYSIWSNLFPASVVEQYADTFAFLTIGLTIFLGVALFRYLFSPLLPRRKK